MPFRRADRHNAAYLARELLGYLPRHRDARPPVLPARPPLGHDPSDAVPADGRSVYDVRDVVRAVVDGGEMLEVVAGWARNLVTGFARLDGHTVGVVANQPRYLGGIIDPSGAEGRALREQVQRVRDPARGARRHPGLHARHQAGVGGVIRFGAEFVHAFAAARCRGSH